jgi:nucleoid-associated protein YgaU
VSGTITIRTPVDESTLTFLLDETAPTPSGDFGGWETVNIPRKRPIRFWSTNPEAKLEVQVILFKEPALTVASQIKRLREMGTGTDDRRPRQVELSGQLPPLPVTRWVIDDVSWGEPFYDRSGNLIRQRLTIQFGEPPNLDAIDVRKGGRSKYRKKDGSRAGKVRYATIRKGETLQEFSARVLGNPSRWKDIAKIQKPPIRDPRKVRDGRKLRLP